MKSAGLIAKIEIHVSGGVTIEGWKYGPDDTGGRHLVGAGYFIQQLKLDNGTRVIEIHERDDHELAR
jgi:hypothetical protein